MDQEPGPAAPALAGLARRLAAAPLSRTEVEASAPLLEAARPADVVDAVHLLVEEGLSMESLKPAVSKLLNLLHGRLTRGEADFGDPLFGLLARENRLVLAALEAAREPLARLNAAEGSGDARAEAARLSRALELARGVEFHYLRLENVVFPFFEARWPRFRCLSLMWSIHDDVRAALRALPGEALLLGEEGGAGLAAFNARIGRLFFDVHSLVFREERILFPVASGLLGPGESEGLAVECLGLGRGLLDEAEMARAAPLPASPAPAGTEGQAKAEGKAASAAGIELHRGSLSPLVLDLILRALPLDLTFIDAEDRVRYFSEGEERIFPRSPSVLGRDVRNCHPSASVGRVMAIVEAFRRGERDREAFWIEKGGRFIHIEYRALRGPDGAYLGTLEASQDLTEKRRLSGERRLASP